MKRVLCTLAAAALFLCSVTAITACESDAVQPVPEQGEQTGEGDDNKDPMQMNFFIAAGGTVFPATLADTPPARAFASLLPLTLRMGELNGNEKYAYLDCDLPTGALRPGTIHAGEMMLYGPNCLVLFYETFSSSYSYTRLGRVEDPAGLAEALGTGDVTVTFRR